MATKMGKHEYAFGCVGSVAYETNGPQGGDAGHGGYLKVTFNTDNCSTALDIAVDGQTLRGVENVALIFKGDEEMRAARECFRYLADNL